MVNSSQTRAEVVALAALLLTGLALRLWLIPKGAFVPDVVLFKTWGEQLVSASLSDFYRIANPPTDYLPGYLYLLFLLESLRRAVSGPVSMLESYTLWIKAPPVLADALLGAAVFILCRRFTAAKRALLATAFVVFNPGIVFVSAIWGQADSVGCALSMLSLAALILGHPTLAAVTGGLAFLTKPQYTLFLAIAGVAYLRAQLQGLLSLSVPGALAVWVRQFVRNCVLPVVALVATLQAVLLPFSVSLWPGPAMEWTLRSRLMAAGTKFPVASLNAFNLWGTPIAGMEVPDSTLGWLSLDYQTWGFVLLAVAIPICLLLAWVRFDDWTAVVWGSFVISLAFFVLSTRIHERYLFAAIPLAACAAVHRLWAAPFFVAASALYFLNLWYAYSISQASNLSFHAMGDPQFTAVASALSVLLLLICLGSVIGLILFSRNQPGDHNEVWTGVAHESRPAVLFK